MAYTQTDEASVRAALIALATGERVVTVTAGDRTTTYAQTDMDKLRSLLSVVQADLASTAGTRRFIRSSTSKGL